MITSRKPIENQTTRFTVKSNCKRLQNCLEKVDAFISLKDHKDNFLSDPKCRFINPAKSEIGKISELFIENINTKIRSLSAVHQWKDTDVVINWF